MNKKIFIGFLGPNGSGKGTILAGLNPELGYRCFSVSTLLKAATSNPTCAQGPEIQHCMQNGLLVGDHLVMPLVQAEIASANTPIIADGFPRTSAQAMALMEMLNQGVIDSLHLIVLDVEDEQILARAADRMVCPSCQTPYTVKGNFNRPRVAGKCDICGGDLVRRKDDDPGVVQKRLHDYHTLTEEGVRLLETAGIQVHRISNDNARPSGEAVMEFNQLLASFLV